MTRRTSVMLTLDELGTLRAWLDEGITQTSERDLTVESPEDLPEVRALVVLDAKLGRAVQRCHRNGDRSIR